MITDLVVRLGEGLFAVERGWGAGRGLVGVSAVAVAADDRVLVLAGRPPAIEVFDRHGNHLVTWGRRVIADGASIAVGGDGRVLVADRAAHQVLLFDRDGALRVELGARGRPRFDGPLNHPAAASFGPGAEIYVADVSRGASIHRFDPEGALVCSWGRFGSGAGELLDPVGLSVDADGRVLVADHGTDRVEVFSCDGEHFASWTDFWRPMSVWAAPDGSVYVTDQITRLSILEPDGTLRGRCRPTPALPRSVWADSAGDLYLAEGVADEVFKLVRTAERAAA